MTPKQQEARGLPAGWSASTLKAAADISAGINKPISEMGKGALYVTVQDLYDGTSIRTAHLGRIRVSETEVQASSLKPGDIVFGKSSVKRDGIGYPSQFLGSDEPVVFSGFTYRARARQGIADPTFLFYALRSGPTRRWLIDNSQASALTNINQRIADAIPVTLPPLNEQRAIAKALSDSDALLAGLDHLIVKKRDLMQAAMQQLLTGQTRLPGFQGEWQVKRLGDLGIFLKGSGVKKDDARSGDLPCVRYGEIYTHHDDYIRSFNSWISHDVAKTATRLKSGDLLFAGSGETKAEIGKCVAFVQECEAYAGGDIVILRPLGVDPLFMGYYCNTAPVNAQKASRGQGDAVVHISTAALAAIAVSLPTQAEQTAIATVLSDMDAELTALEARRNKNRALKQGMMQELLTGRTRLV
jgi:type I restriction enzyme S subunit